MGEIKLLDTVRESTTDDGRRLRQGFFLTRKAGDRFAARGRAKGLQMIERGVPTEIVIETNHIQTTSFIFSLDARKIAAKIAMTAMAYEYGIPFVLSPQFDMLRQASLAKVPNDRRVRGSAN